MSPLLKKGIAFTLALVLVLNVTFLATAKPAHAQFAGVVFDPTNFVQNTISAVEAVAQTAIQTVVENAELQLVLKEFVLDPLAWALAKIAIAEMTQQTVNIINFGGIGGNPQYVQNPYQFFDMLQDRTTVSFVNGLINNAGIDPRIAALIGQNVVTSRLNQYNFQQQMTPTVAPAVQTQFEQGSYFNWDTWDQQFLNDQNNVYGANELAQEQLQNQQNTVAYQESQKLQQGQGFSPVDSCYKQWNNVQIGNNDPSPLSYLCAVLTPGQTISGVLSQQLNSGQRTFEAADEIDEIIGQFLVGLLNNVLGLGLYNVNPNAGGYNVGTNPQFPNLNNVMQQVGAGNLPTTQPPNVTVPPGTGTCGTGAGAPPPVAPPPPPPPPPPPATDANGNPVTTGTGTGTGGPGGPPPPPAPPTGT